MSKVTVVLMLLCTLLSLCTPLSAQDGTQPVLKILGASDRDELKLAINSSQFRRLFFVDSMNKNKVDKLRISVAPFVGPDSQLVETRWKVNENPGSDAEVAVPGLESVKLEISADLPKEGDYTGAITLIYSDKRFPVQIVVTRSRPKPAIKND